MASKVPFRFEIVSFDLGSPRIDDVVSFYSSVFLSETDRSRRLVHDAMQRKDYFGRVAYVDDAAVAMAYGAACIVGHWWVTRSRRPWDLIIPRSRTRGI